MNTKAELEIRAKKLGASGLGVCKPSALPHNIASLTSILPGCRSVVCVMVAHSPTALASSDIYVKQYDTIYCYAEVARISHELVRYLEAEGHLAVAVPAFLPLDMADGSMGMVGAVDWKQAAVESGLGSWGESGLVITPRFGPRIRLGGVVTTADLPSDERLTWNPCRDCGVCIRVCPSGALSGQGRIDKKRCGDYIFSYGLRAFTRLLVDLAEADDAPTVRNIIYTRRTREVWQALETGNYYYCWTCQSSCPIGLPHVDTQPQRSSGE